MDEIKKEVSSERRRQTKAVMPLIGPLLDCWDELPNDVKSEPELEGLAEWINKINDGMEG